MHEIETFSVLGVPIAITTPLDASQMIEHWAKDDVGRFVCIRDIPSLMSIKDNPEIAGLHRAASMVAPDSAYLTKIGQLKGLPIERTCGPDLMEMVLSRSVESGLSHYFYGGKQGVAEKLATVFQQRFPGIRIVGTECPPFRSLSDGEIAATLMRIRESGADIVWVGISSPKQDVWMWKNYQHLPQTLIGVGAAFDFHTGIVSRAPTWVQTLMLEWAFRLATDPKRLWRRYLVLAPKFVFQLLSSKTHLKSKPNK